MRRHEGGEPAIKTTCAECGRYDRSGIVSARGFWCWACSQVLIPDSAYYAIEDGAIWGGPFDPEHEDATVG